MFVQYAKCKLLCFEVAHFFECQLFKEQISGNRYEAILYSPQKDTLELI